MECPICFYNWNPESTVPIILTCGHSICLECCSSLFNKNQVICPSCSLSNTFPLVKRSESESEDSYKSRCINSLTKNYTLLNAIPSRATNNKGREFKYGMKCKKHNLLIHSYVSRPYSMLCDSCLEDIRGLTLTVIPFPEVVQKCKENLEILQSNISNLESSLSGLNLNSEETVQSEVKKHFAGIRQQLNDSKSQALENLYSTIQEHKEKQKKRLARLQESKNLILKHEKDLEKLEKKTISEKIKQKQALENLILTSNSAFNEETCGFILDINIEQEIVKVFKDFVSSSVNVKIVDSVKVEKWLCSCGLQIQTGRVQCECDRFRPVQSYASLDKGKVLESDIAEIQLRREIEMEWINKLDEDLEPDTWYLINADWVNAWKAFVLNKSTRQRHSNSEVGVLPPGPINNWSLLKEDGDLKPKLKAAVHYRAINKKVWETYIFIYGGGPEITRKSLNIYDN